MIPEPLHPAVVHFPIVLAVLLPIAAVVAIASIRRGSGAMHAWMPVVAIAAVLAASAWAAVETGQGEEERVEEVVPESAIEGHEEAAEVFLPMAAAVLLIVGLGLLGGQRGAVMRYVAVVGAVVLLAQGVRVGHSGGELVYVHGASSAYTSGDLPVADSREGDERSLDRDDDRR